MNYFLVLHNHPPVTTHEEERKSYYEALEAWDMRQEPEPLCDFLRWQTVRRFILFIAPDTSAAKGRSRL